MIRSRPTENRWRAGLLLALGLFLFSRLLTLNAFPIFNDEAIYLQYSQKIHEDWQRNKFVSMHGEFTDWKPPLQYWIAAPVIDWGNDPLVAGRAVAFLASIAGLLGFYLFSKELFTEREGVFAALLYVLCPPALFHNTQFTAETFLFSTAPLFYWALLKTMRANKWDWVWAIVASLLGTALLLFKQSGFLLLAISILLPLARCPEKTNPAKGPVKLLVRNVSLVIGVLICCYLVANAVLPSEFQATRERFDRNWVMSVPELLAPPISIWRRNLGIVADYIGSYYSWAAVLLFCGFVWFASRRRDPRDLTLAAMCFAGAGGIIFLLRGFNEYLFNTAIIAVLLPLFARVSVVIKDFFRERKGGLMPLAAIPCAAFMIGYWGYQDILMGASPGKYIERSSPWATANYLKSWSTGFGIKEIVAILETETGPGIVFTDAQWGNPGTALEVYRAIRFPKLRIVPISREFLDPLEMRKLTEAAKKMASVHFVIFSADRSEPRRQWLDNVERELCETRREIRAYPSQTPIVVCRF